MASKAELYYKELKDLKIDEIYVYGVKIGVQKPTSTQKKSDLVREILNRESSFLDDPSRKFYFAKDNNSLKLISKPADVSKYTVKAIGQQYQINVMEIKNAFEAEKLKAKELSEQNETSVNLNEFQIDDDCISGKDENEYVIPEVNPIDAIKKLLESSIHKNVERPERNFQFRQKIKYEPAHGIEAFIRSIEAYGAANLVSDKSKWVAIAKSALNQSEDGLLIQDSLLPAEEKDWDLFKTKLLSILGRAPDYYRDHYRSFRRGTYKPGLALSRLTQSYKRGFLNGNELTEADKRHIMLQFIESLDNPLRGLVKAEESRLSFSTIADRTAELERCFGTNFGIENAAALMYPGQQVIRDNATSVQKTQETVQIKMLELLNTLTIQSKEQHKELLKMVNKKTPEISVNREYRNENNYKKRRNENDYHQHMEFCSKLQGHCFSYLKYGNCQRGNCQYKHERNAPREIKQLFA